MVLYIYIIIVYIVKLPACLAPNRYYFIVIVYCYFILVVMVTSYGYGLCLDE